MSHKDQSATVTKRNTFPKAARLLKTKEFKFRKFKKIKLEHFNLIIEENGSGKLGVSIGKRILKRAVWRNRVRRVIREAFRTERNLVGNRNLHFIAQSGLFETWEKIKPTAVKQMIKKAVL